MQHQGHQHHYERAGPATDAGRPGDRVEVVVVHGLDSGKASVPIPFMSRRWKSDLDLALAIQEKAIAGENVVLSPETAFAVANWVVSLPPPPDAKFRIDVHADGSAIYELDDAGEIKTVEAFARNALAARAAFDYMCRSDPNGSFSQRRRSWIEAERIGKGKRRAR